MSTIELATLVHLVRKFRKAFGYFPIPEGFILIIIQKANIQLANEQKIEVAEAAVRFNGMLKTMALGDGK